MRHLVVATHELETRTMRVPSNRCFLLQEELFTTLEPIARREGALPYIWGQRGRLGTTAPACSRPARGSARAADRRGLTKARSELSRELGFRRGTSVVRRLSSRFSRRHITKGKLRQVDAAEELLRSLGFRLFRVRHHGPPGAPRDPADEIARPLGRRAPRDDREALPRAGLRLRPVDLGGSKSGSANILLKPAAAARG